MKEIEELLDKVLYDENVEGFILSDEKFKLLKIYIINLHQAIKDTKDTADDMLYELKQENEKLKAQLTDTEWQWQNTRFKYEKQYKKGITEELLEDIETCFFNRENPSMIPIDSLDLCHIFGYIDYLKDYKSRCEKAIEYINNNFDKTGENVSGTDLPYSYIEDLLNILQNGSDTIE